MIAAAYKDSEKKVESDKLLNRINSIFGTGSVIAPIKSEGTEMQQDYTDDVKEGENTPGGRKRTMTVTVVKGAKTLPHTEYVQKLQDQQLLAKRKAPESQSPTFPVPAPVTVGSGGGLALSLPSSRHPPETSSWSSSSTSFLANSSRRGQDSSITSNGGDSIVTATGDEETEDGDSTPFFSSSSAPQQISYQNPLTSSIQSSTNYHHFNSIYSQPISTTSFAGTAADTPEFPSLPATPCREPNATGSYDDSLHKKPRMS